jgi:hypothetical protein
MAMGKAIVSTALGSEGIEAIPGRDLLIEDQPEAFADALNRLFDDPELAARIGQSARSLAVERYSWSGAARRWRASTATFWTRRSRIPNGTVINSPARHLPTNWKPPGAVSRTSSAA